jgi:SAM-dependent methyltransferase
MAAGDNITYTVKEFYEKNPFPGYEEFDSLHALMDKAEKGVYAKMLDEQLPVGVRVIDIGCGTGQLPIFLSMSNRTVMGADLCLNSLKKGNDFKNRFEVDGVAFIQMDIFNLPFAPESFDFVLCNGVLHHTKDAYLGFRSIAQLVRSGGYIIIGLYSKYGRLLTDLRREIFRLTGDRLLFLDYFLRRKALDPEKKRVWFMDQYKHPHETKHTVDEVLEWFAKNSFEFINALPKIALGEELTIGERLFSRHDPGRRIEHLLRQLGWIFSISRDGGYFLMIGRKRGRVKQAEGSVNG